MPIKARIYIGSVVLLGLAILLTCLVAAPRFPDVGRFLQCLVLATVASTFKIRLPGMQSSISLNFVLNIIAIAALSLTASLLIGAAATVVERLCGARTRPTLIQVLFNTAALLISVSGAFLLTAQIRNGQGYVPGVVIAGVILFVVNTWLVSLVLALLRGVSALNTWRTCHAWAFPYYVAGAAFAVVVSACAQICGWAAALAMLPGLYLLYAYYDMVIKRTHQVSTL